MIHFDVSTQGSRIAYSTCRYPGISDQAEAINVPYRRYNYEIVVSDIDGTDAFRLTRNDHFDNFPVWSPDDAHIAYISDPDPTHDAYETMGRLTIHTMSTGLSRDIVLPIGDTISPYPPGMVPGRKRIAFVAYEYHDQGGTLVRRRAVYTVALDGSELARISDAFSGPSWSPDGQRIALAVPGDADRVDLYTFAYDGSDPVLVTRIVDGIGVGLWALLAGEGILVP